MTTIEKRNGIRLSDQLLDLFPRHDVSFSIMYLLYISLLVSIVHLLFHPDRLLFMLKTSFLVTSIRFILIYLFPLEPPVGLIPLSDPFLEATIYESQKITKDLFFSGHTSSMFIMFLCVKNNYLKSWLAIGTGIIAVLLLIQRVHYSYDVVVAPFACYACFRLAKHSWIPEKREISY